MLTRPSRNVNPLTKPPHPYFSTLIGRLETKNTYHRADPSFTYLLAFFMLLTGTAWGIAYAPSIASAVRLPLIFVFVHFLAISVLVATAAFFLVGRLLGPGIPGLPGRRRQQGLFTPVGEGESLEFGYCFDVSGIATGEISREAWIADKWTSQVAIRAFFPVWVMLYVVQFLLWPLVSRDYW